MLIFLMQEISNSLDFLGTLFHTFFMLFMRVEKITDFRFPARLIDAVTCTEILCLRTPHFNCGAVPDSARNPGGTLCPFHSFRLFCILIFLGKCIQSECAPKKCSDLSSFFRSRLPAKMVCSIDV